MDEQNREGGEGGSQPLVDWDQFPNSDGVGACLVQKKWKLG